jgi:UDP-glucose 4-epimerase
VNVLVTGGAGFIGHHFVPELLAAGHDVTILDNLRRGSFERPGLRGSRCLEGDVRDRATCRIACAGVDVVVHLAAQANVIGSQAGPEYAFETNVTGTWNILSGAADAGVRHLVFTSSREVYGDPDSLPVAEDAALRPHNLYGATKVAGETLLRCSPFPLPRVSVLRLANVIGPGDAGRVVPIWLAAARANEPLVAYGGQQVLDLVPVDVVALALLRTIERGPLPAPVNVGSGVGTPLLDIAAQVLAVTGSGSGIDLQPAREIEVSRFCAETSRLRDLLGVEPPADPVAAIEASW